MAFFFQDVRFALRNLRAHPAFALVAVITIALGIGANTAIFSVVNAMLFRDLPYAESDRLVRIWSTNAARRAGEGELAAKLAATPISRSASGGARQPTSLAW